MMRAGDNAADGKRALCLAFPKERAVEFRFANKWRGLIADIDKLGSHHRYWKRDCDLTPFCDWRAQSRCRRRRAWHLKFSLPAHPPRPPQPVGQWRARRIEGARSLGRIDASFVFWTQFANPAKISIGLTRLADSSLTLLPFAQCENRFMNVQGARL